MTVEKGIQRPHYERTVIPRYGQGSERGMHFIFITRDEFRGDLRKLNEEYFETHKRIAIPQQALLVDLRCSEPRVKSVPIGYTLPTACS
jgi:hypothetical protein